MNMKLESRNLKTVELQLANGKVFTVVAKNLDKENRYIRAVKLNGKGTIIRVLLRMGRFCRVQHWNWRCVMILDIYGIN